MADPKTPAEPSLSAAELRRRLLASTPPPVAASAASPDFNLADLPQSTTASGAWSSSSGTDLLARLRMPGGKSGWLPRRRRRRPRCR